MGRVEHALSARSRPPARWPAPAGEARRLDARRALGSRNGVYRRSEAPVDSVSRTQCTTRRMARRERLDPAVAYRLVRRATGLRWSDVRRAGLAAALQRLRDLCTPRIFGARPTIRDPGLDAEVVGRSVAPRALAQSPAMRGHP